MQSRRALLYTPGDDWHKISKAANLGVDCICLDIEDGVALNRKATARETIFKALETIDFGQSERLVRINPPGSDYGRDDLVSILPAKPDGIVIPKVNSAGEVKRIGAVITEFEQTSGLPMGQIGLIAIIESARSILNLSLIANADPRLQALIFGAEDFASDIGAIRTESAWEIFHARSSVVTTAAAFNLQAIDMVNINFQDISALREEAQMGASMGFSGKQIIHPNQVDPVQEAFTPREEEIREALLILNSFNEHQKEGIGAFALNGKMIDAPLARAAERVLVRAKAAGKIN